MPENGLATCMLQELNLPNKLIMGDVSSQAKRERGRDVEDVGDLDVKRARVEEPEEEAAAPGPGWAQMPEQAQWQAVSETAQAPSPQHHIAAVSLTPCYDCFWR